MEVQKSSCMAPFVDPSLDSPCLFGVIRVCYRCESLSASPSCMDFPTLLTLMEIRFFITMMCLYPCVCVLLSCARIMTDTDACEFHEVIGVTG